MEIYRIISEEDYQRLLDNKPMTKKVTFDTLNKIQKRKAYEIVRLLKKSGNSPDEDGVIKLESMPEGIRLEPQITFLITGRERPEHFETFLTLLTSSKLPLSLVHKTVRAEVKELKKNAKKRKPKPTTD